MKLPLHIISATITLMIVAAFASLLGIQEASAMPVPSSSLTTFAVAICPDGTPATSEGDCPTDNARSCYRDWNDTELLKGGDRAKKYDKSGCDKSSGGNCKSKTITKDGKKYLEITCDKPPASGGGDDSSSTISDPALNCHTDNCDLVSNYINPAIRLLSVLVGIAVVVGIIVGGIQVSTSAGDPQKAANGKNHIRNALIALVAYVLLFVVLNWLIPGGIT